MAIARVHLLVEGRVQGVGFRWATRREALRLGLGGWVRNLPDGRVEVVAEGDAPPVERIVDWCRRGPLGAQVIELTVEREEPTGEFDDFSIGR